MAACWAAAAAYFDAGDWWSLSWGAPQLAKLAGAHARGLAPGTALTHAHGVLAATVRSSGVANLAHALALRPVWGPCYDSAKAAGAALAVQLQARRFGKRAQRWRI